MSRRPKKIDVEAHRAGLGPWLLLKRPVDPARGCSDCLLMHRGGPLCVRHARAIDQARRS